MTVQPGDFVSLRCTSLASPLAPITWSVDEQAVANSARYRFGDFVVGSGSGSSSSPLKSSTNHLQSSRLVSHFNITSVRVEDGGLYRCTAANVAGSVAHSARLNVYGKAAVKVHTPNATALSSTDIELNCPFYGYPLKSITWFGRGMSSILSLFLSSNIFFYRRIISKVAHQRSPAHITQWYAAHYQSQQERR